MPFTKKILLVEDCLITSKIYKSILEESGELNCKVDVSWTGKQALELIEKYPYNLVLMDIHLPDMDGYDVSKQIRSQENPYIAQIPIIILSEHIEEEDNQKYKEAKINGLIVKPMTKLLINQLQKFLI